MGPRLKPNREVEEMLRTNFGRLASEFSCPIEFVAEKLSGYGVATLERLATALYFIKHSPGQEDVEKAKKINRVKPHISEALALQALKQVNQILEEWTTSVQAGPHLADRKGRIPPRASSATKSRFTPGALIQSCPVKTVTAPQAGAGVFADAPLERRSSCLARALKHTLKNMPFA
jgi:hypothetical protein